VGWPVIKYPASGNVGAVRHNGEDSLREDRRMHAQVHPYSALGLRVSVGMLLLLLLTSGWRLLDGQASVALRWGFLGGLVAFVGTAAGAIPALMIRNLSPRIEDIFLGLAAGMMLAASSFSRLLPGLDAGAELTGSPVLGGSR
jgi:ZIP family zinc transporter